MVTRRGQNRQQHSQWDLLIAELQRIAQHMEAAPGGAAAGGGGPGGSGGVGGGLTELDPNDFYIFETDDLDDVDQGGTVTLSPGDSKKLCEAEIQQDAEIIQVLAVGATDETGVTYELVLDHDRTLGGRTNSPLGLLNEPYSFVDDLQAYAKADKHATYRATYDSTASGEVNLAARMFCLITQE